IGLNLAHYRSVVSEFPINNSVTRYADGEILTQEGKEPNLFYGYKTEGVFASNIKASETNLLNRNSDGSFSQFRGGDIHFSDLNNDQVIDSLDRTIIGNPNPDYFGGITTHLTWRNWTLGALFTFIKGNDVYNYSRRRLESMNSYANQTEAVMNRWVKKGQITEIPKAEWGDPMGNGRFSDRWIEDGSYLRLK